MSQTTNISEIGEAIYPHLNKPDVRFSEAGEYKVTLKVAKSDATEMLKLYNKAIEDSLKLAEQNHKGKGIKNAPKPFTEEDGFVFFKSMLVLKANESFFLVLEEASVFWRSIKKINVVS